MLALLCPLVCADGFPPHVPNPASDPFLPSCCALPQLPVVATVAVAVDAVEDAAVSVPRARVPAVPR